VSKSDELNHTMAEAIAAYFVKCGVSPDRALVESPSGLVIAHFVTVREHDHRSNSGFITMQPGGHGGGRSRKLGNVRLNLRKLVEALATAGLSAVGLAQAPWAAPLAALVLWSQLRSTTEVSVSEREAAVIWTMWAHRRTEDNTISDDQLFSLVNRELRESGRHEISREELDASLDILSRVGTVSTWKNDTTRWWLREWVSVSF
jgi:hypothetical protein